MGPSGDLKTKLSLIIIEKCGDVQKMKDLRNKINL